MVIPIRSMLAGVLLAGALVAGCKSSETTAPPPPPPPPPAPVASVLVSPPSATIQVGATTALTATPRDASGNTLAGRTVTWTTSNPSVATVANGVVTGVSPGGPVQITATSELRSASSDITVVPVPVASVTLSATTATVMMGQTTTLTATLRDAANAILTGRTIAWSTGNAAIATVANGVVTGVAAGGPVTITASSEGKSASAEVTVTPIPAVTTSGAISVGTSHACGLIGTEAHCWGSGAGGRLGTGFTPIIQASRQPVSGGHAFTSITAGLDYTCALKANGQAWCWGANASGQLGDGTFTNRLIPVAVTGGKAFVRLYAGPGATTCGLEASGAAWCWGRNGDSGVGDGTVTNRNAPIAVSGGHLFASLAVTVRATCGITTGGAMLCWGGGDFGVFGNGNVTGSTTPVPATAGHQFAVLGSGEFSLCGRKADGTGWCWGQDNRGSLASGGTPNTSRTTPNAMVGGLEFTNLTMGDWHGCGRLMTGAVYCWGAGGRRGDGGAGDLGTPSLVSGGLVFTEVDAGFSSSCGRTTDGEFYCWGVGASGQLGNGNVANSAVPVQVTNVM